MSLFSRLLPTIAGAALGGLSGGKGGKTTSTSAPELPENVKKAWDKLLKNSELLAEKPYEPAVTTRVEPNSMYGGLFNNPEMQAIQNASDAKYINGMGQQAPQASPSQSPSEIASMRGRMEMQRLAGMGGVYSNKNTQPYEAFNNSATDADYAQIGQFLQDGGQVNYGVGVDKQGIMNPAIIELLNKYRRG